MLSIEKVQASETGTVFEACFISVHDDFQRHDEIAAGRVCIKHGCPEFMAIRRDKSVYYLKQLLTESDCITLFFKNHLAIRVKDFETRQIINCIKNRAGADLKVDIIW